MNMDKFYGFLLKRHKNQLSYTGTSRKSISEGL
jgi:hypothetical protein